VALQYTFPHGDGFPLGLVVLVREAAVGDVFPFGILFRVYFLQNGLYMLVVQLFPSQSGWIPAS
jgi:hypothetical protein